jgi:hypothetical protein
MFESKIKEILIMHNKKPGEFLLISLLEDHSPAVFGTFKAPYGANPEVGNIPSDIIRDIAMDPGR